MSTPGNILMGLKNTYVRLFLCGAAILFWELTIIRWFGTNIRIVAYFTNFVLMATFLGLGAGALLARFRVNFYIWLFPLLTGCILLGTFLGMFSCLNPASPDEYIWRGSPESIFIPDVVKGFPYKTLPVWFVLSFVYICTAAVFAFFGQMLGKLFQAADKPLTAYSMEIGGSIAGIVLFALMSQFHLPPVYWMGLGCVLLLLVSVHELGRMQILLTVICIPAILFFTFLTTSQFIWSPYYKIFTKPLFEIIDYNKKLIYKFNHPVGIGLTVNSDYHQMILNLTPTQKEEPEFFKSWRALYDLPYAGDEQLPAGPILIIGAGTGNDVAAALRNTKRDVVAVEIDPVIVAIGRQLHFEAPYANPRVKIIVNDARSYLQQTNQKFAMVVFGFLDSHTLLSSFSTLRLDNFIYTTECMKRVEEIMLPGGEVSVTFASNREWIDRRISALLQNEFDEETKIFNFQNGKFANGTVYINFKQPDHGKKKVAGGIDLPSDDWPFLYLQKKTIPEHYRFFMLFIAMLGFLPLLILPRGSRSIRLPFFFMGAAFFLIETSNIVSLSLLYGSTWTVNVLVFTGILALILAANISSSFIKNYPLKSLFSLLLFSIGIAYATPTSLMLEIHSIFLRTFAAVLIYLGPIYFAGLIFAILIRNERNLFQVYGSNLLGAVLGGACEYFSMILGFKFLLLLTLFFYGLAFMFTLKKGFPLPANFSHH